MPACQWPWGPAVKTTTNDHSQELSLYAWETVKHEIWEFFKCVIYLRQVTTTISELRETALPWWRSDDFLKNRPFLNQLVNTTSRLSVFETDPEESKSGEFSSVTTCLLFLLLIQITSSCCHIFITYFSLRLHQRFSRRLEHYTIEMYFHFCFDNFLLEVIIIISIPLRIFHTSVSWRSFTGVWVTVSPLLSPGLFSVFWPI